MQLKAAQRLYEGLHKDRPFHDGTFTRWAEKPSRAFPFRFDDGVYIHVTETDLNPDDRFLDDEHASPLTPENPPPRDRRPA